MAPDPRPDPPDLDPGLAFFFVLILPKGRGCVWKSPVFPAGRFPSSRESFHDSHHENLPDHPPPVFDRNLPGGA